MDSENLNIDYNHRILIIKSLSTSKTVKDAANKLGIHERTLWNKIYEIRDSMNRWDVEIADNVKKKYFTKPKIS